MIKVLPIKEACQVAISNRLYVAGWDMRSKYASYLRCESGIKHIALYYDKDKPVACAIVTYFKDIQVFVKSTYRRKGIGTKLVNHMKDEVERAGGDVSKIDAGEGIAGSHHFWKSNNIPLW